MKVFAVSKRQIFAVAALTFLAIAGSVSAFAVPVIQVGRTSAVQSVTAKCCVLINPMVRVSEPTAVTPVIVTWSADYNVSGTAEVALSVNGGPCLAYGPFVVQEPVVIAGSDSITVSHTYQWVVLPSDGLLTGTNTFQVCIGGFSKTQTVNIGFSTLTVQIGK